jgi:tetratricopeptide (TPR) repeat protein
MKMAVDAGVPGTEETEWARQTLANLHLRRGELQAAERELLMSLAIRPDYPFALAGLARVRGAQGRTEEALRLLDSASKLIPEFSFIELQADLHRASGNDRAADSLVAAVEGMLREDEAAGHLADKEFALLYANHNIKASEALARARKEHAGRPDNIEAEHALALALLRNGSADEAKSHIDRAMRMGTRNAEMIAHAGLIEMKLGNRARAKKFLSEARPHVGPLLLDEVRSALRML